MRRPWRGVAFYMNGPAFVIAIVTFPFVLLQNLMRATSDSADPNDETASQ
ncbi:MAG: hypothetical protein ACK5CE_22900 [Actinomycetes bacterium]